MLLFLPGIFGETAFDLETALVKQRSETEKHLDRN